MVQLTKKPRLSWRWVVFVPIPILWCVLSHFGLLDFWENRTVDWRFRVRGELESPLKIVYVDVDDRSIEEIGNWPWTRHFFATAAQALIEQGHARAVGFDFIFSPQGAAQSADKKLLADGDAALGRYVVKYPPAVPPPVVFGASFTAGDFYAKEGRVLERDLPLIATDKRKVEEIEPPEETAFERPGGKTLAPPYLGLIDTMHGGTRTVATWVPTRTHPYNHMSIELARLYWGLPIDGVRRSDSALTFAQADGSVIQEVPLREKQLLDINWFSAWGSIANSHESFFVVYTYADGLTSKDEEVRKISREFFARDKWKNAVVLIGPVAPLLQDLATTPFDDDPVPKVGVHGNLLKTILSGRFLQRVSPWATYGLVFALTLLIAGFASAGGAGGARSKLTALLLLISYLWVAFHLFAKSDLILPLVAPLGAIFSTTFVAVAWQLVEEERQKRRIKGMFGAYVSPELVNRMSEAEEEPKLGGHDAEITAYFSDIQGFSTFSEKLGSGPLVELMNEYLTACTDIVTAQGGTLDKYIGDAVVAMFGAPIPMPDHAFRACVATQKVHLKLAELRTKWESEGEKWPQIVWKMQSRIGLNSGTCMIGNMGSRTRFNYTMMGDNVNLAARMESGAKSWGAYTMCTEATKLECEKHGGDRVIFRPLGRIVVKGRTLAVPIYEIVGLKESVSHPTLECVEIFSAALEKYYARDWDNALRLLRRSREVEFNVPGKTPGVVSNPSLVYIDIIEHYQVESPPENWDGVYHMKEK